MSKPIVALAGGVGAARFLDGLVRVTDPARLWIVGNTADDTEMHGLHISPDLDTVAYTLAGLANPQHGWGLNGDTFHCLEALRKLGAEAWFQLGDRDFATHLYRTVRLREGATLSQVTKELTAAWGLPCKLLPMTDQRVRTLVKTRGGVLDFQTYFVRRRSRDTVLGVTFDGASRARPAPRLLPAIRQAAGIIICPSNPIISVGPILAVPGIREALRKSAATVAAISPIVGGRALKGPAARMMKSLGMRVSAFGVAELYRDFVDVFILDQVDASQAAKVEALGMRVVVTDTIMTSTARKKALARVVAGSLQL
jgi:LPPG:FO 2-phospho-L-lactate transferase